MSLRVYARREDIPVGMEVVEVSDLFFDSYELKDDALTRKILMEVDRAIYASPCTFIGRDKELGPLDKSRLSTGCKTLLNVVYHPDICFNVLLCGQNALELLYLIREGNILWEKLTLFSMDDTLECDIEMEGRRFGKFEEFIAYIMDEREELKWKELQ